MVISAETCAGSAAERYPSGRDAGAVLRKVPVRRIASTDIMLHSMDTYYTGVLRLLSALPFLIISAWLNMTRKDGLQQFASSAYRRNR